MRKITMKIYTFAKKYKNLGNPICFQKRKFLIQSTLPQKHPPFTCPITFNKTKNNPFQIDFVMKEDFFIYRTKILITSGFCFNSYC